MKIRIEYCVPCGYKKRADAAAAAIREQLGVDAELVPGNGGVFRVHVDDRTAIARSRENFPSPAEIVTAVRHEYRVHRVPARASKDE